MLVLSKGLVKQQFASSLTAAVLLSAVGANVAAAQSTVHLPEAKQDSESVVSSPVSDSVASSSMDVTTDNPVTLSQTSGTILSSSALGNSEALRSGTELAPSLSSDILVYAHAIDGRQAATLYVKDIPVLTFIGTDVDSLSNNKEGISLAASDPSVSLQVGTTTPSGNLLSAQESSDPVLRATDLGAQLGANSVEADSISVRWNEETDGYTITLAGEDLISLDSRTILSDTTQDPAEDALQAANRLRRLLGGADPISEIEGLPEPEPVEVAPAQTVAIVSSTVGGASWYGPGFDGRLSASGEVFNQYDLTAAHRSLPFGTRVLVTNLYNGRQVTVRINDRGPYAGDRIIDLSAGAAEAIGLIDSGVGTVQLDILAN